MESRPAPEAQDPAVRLAALPEALDGYPVEALAELCREAESHAHALALAKRLITTWVAHLTHDIESVKLPAPDAFVRARRRMIDTRDSLLEVQSRFAELEDAERG